MILYAFYQIASEDDDLDDAKIKILSSCFKNGCDLADELMSEQTDLEMLLPVRVELDLDSASYTKALHGENCLEKFINNHATKQTRLSILKNPNLTSVCERNSGDQNDVE